MIKEFEQSDGKQLQLTEHAIKHIVQGNFAIRPMNGQDDQIVLSGGLHTYDGWVEFKKKYADELEHVHFFNSHKHKYWYYARELGNEVITLRLPRCLFTGKAAKITMLPDDYYKSGYLWKTLFPKNYDRDRIIDVIEEALKHEDIDQRQKGRIIGYINNNDPLLKMKVVIQYRGNEIKSAFPAWTQPNTGNNGKPYSHYENIGFVIAQSTEYFDDAKKANIAPVYTFSGTNISPEELHHHTPTLFTSRSKVELNESPAKWALKRKQELKKVSLSKDENDMVFQYLNDFFLVKHYPELISGVYNHAIEGLIENSSVYNTFQVVQNFVDGLNYLYISDQFDRLIETIQYILNNMISHTLFDLLSKKKIISTIINIVDSANNPELSYRFIEAFSHSPIRREGYLEYNIDSISKKKLNVPIDDFPDELMMVSNPSLEVKMTYGDFLETIKETFGETYTLNFHGDDLDNLFEKIISNQSANYENLIIDSLSYFSRDDFTSLSECIGDILTSASKYEVVDQESLVTYTGLILRDYCRIQFAHRHRINARYINYHDFANTMYLPIDHNLLFGLILKHERWANSYKLENFTKEILAFAIQVSNDGLKNDTENFIKKIGHEKPPLPERIIRG